MSREITPEMMGVMERVIAIHAPCYEVAGYEVDDIKQEAFILCMNIIEKWDGIRPLENFLVVSLSRKLKSFVRDKRKLQGNYADINERIMRPIDIDSVDWDSERCLIEPDNVGASIEYGDLLRGIDGCLPVGLRGDYLRMRAGVEIGRGRQKKIREYISRFLGEGGVEKE